MLGMLIGDERAGGGVFLNVDKTLVARRERAWPLCWAGFHLITGGRGVPLSLWGWGGQGYVTRYRSTSSLLLLHLLRVCLYEWLRWWCHNGRVPLAAPLSRCLSSLRDIYPFSIGLPTKPFNHPWTSPPLLIRRIFEVEVISSEFGD